MHYIRLVTDEDQAIHRQLLAERLPTTDIEARLRWIYRSNPHGPAHVWMAFDEPTGEAAGMTTFFGRKLWVEGTLLDGAIGGDMYVRPRFRRRGIGADLFRAARADMDKLGLRFMFGTPMAPNVTALVSSGSTVPEGAVVRYARPLGTSVGRLAWLPRPARRLMEPLLKPRSRPGSRLDPIVGLDARVDRLWEETRGELSVATVRDATFYQWRFVDSPSGVQRPFIVLEDDQPIAACALERVKDKLRVVDLLAPRARFRTALLAIAGTAPLAGDAALLEMRMAVADAAGRDLWKAGLFPRNEGPMSILTSPKESGGAPSWLHDASRWFLTWADTDIDHA